jgi:hypothetical protein
MMSASTQKDNIALAFFIALSIGALYLVQTRHVEIPSQNTAAVITAPTSESNRQEEAVTQETTTDHLKGELVTTDHKPEAGQAVTFSLKSFTNSPEAVYYLLLGSKKLPFTKGSVTYTFTGEGDVQAELRCAFRGKDVVLDYDTYTVEKKMNHSRMSDLIDN